MDQPSTPGRKAAAFFFFRHIFATLSEHGGAPLVTGGLEGDFSLQGVFLSVQVGLFELPVEEGDFLPLASGNGSASRIPGKS